MIAGQGTYLVQKRFSCRTADRSVIGIFVVYAVQLSIPASRSIQWQLPFIVQLVIPVLGFTLSFFVPESPRFLLGRGKEASAVQILCLLRNLPEDAPYIIEECAAMKEAHFAEEIAKGGSGFLGLLKECFTVRNYFRRTRTVIIAYVLAQFSGANSISECIVAAEAKSDAHTLANYLPTILALLGVTNTNQRLLYTAGYSIAKLGCLFIASLFFVDIVGRRKSLLIGVTVQGLCQ
jgi:MFS family permease